MVDWFRKIHRQQSRKPGSGPLPPARTWAPVVHQTFGTGDGLASAIKKPTCLSQLFNREPLRHGHLNVNDVCQGIANGNSRPKARPTDNVQSPLKWRRARIYPRAFPSVRSRDSSTMFSFGERNDGMSPLQGDSLTHQIHLNLTLQAFVHVSCSPSYKFVLQIGKPGQCAKAEKYEATITCQLQNNPPGPCYTIDCNGESEN